MLKKWIREWKEWGKQKNINKKIKTRAKRTIVITILLKTFLVVIVWYVVNRSNNHENLFFTRFCYFLLDILALEYVCFKHGNRSQKSAFYFNISQTRCVLDEDNWKAQEKFYAVLQKKRIDNGKDNEVKVSQAGLSSWTRIPYYKQTNDRGNDDN